MKHYEPTSISSPVTNDAVVIIVLVLSLIFLWSAELIDVQSEFLFGSFKDEGKICMGVLEGFE
jgi:hypothetical protein